VVIEGRADVLAPRKKVGREVITLTAVRNAPAERTLSGSDRLEL
jgi:hypothetical protein